MKFTSESLNRCVARLGALSCFERIPELKLETPLLMLYTKRGSVPHVTKDVLEMITAERQLLTISLPTTFHMTDPVKHFESISDFVGLKEYPVLLTIQDPGETTIPGFNEKDTVALWTRHGKRLMNPDQYMDLVEAFKPDFYMALCDGNTNIESTLKRVEKSLERSRIMLDKCLIRHNGSKILKNKGILAAVEGGYNIEARIRFIKTLEGIDFAGYVIDGLHNNGPETEKITFQTIENVIRNTINLLPHDKMRVVMGSWNPETVIDLVALGVDLFDSSYPYSVTERSCALTFLCEHSATEDQPLILISEARYADDFKPICEACECLTCKNHTRAYLHHLHHTKELLERVLLMIHNTHHYLQYFEEIRNSLKNGTFEDLRNRIHKKFANKILTN